MTASTAVRPASVTTRSVPPQIMLLGGIASVQFGAAFADRLFDRAGPGGVVFLRLLLSALVLLAITRPSLRGRSRADLLAVLGFGAVLATMNWTFYESIARLPLGVAVTIEFVGPLVLAVAGSRRLLDVLWVVLAAAGVTLLALRGHSSGVRPVGVALALGAAALWACYILLSKRVGAAFDNLDGLAIALGIGATLLIPVGVVQGLVDHHGALLHPAIIGGGFAVAMLSSLVPYSLELLALRRLSAASFGLLMSLEPAVAAVAGVIVLGQRLTVVVLVAVAFVVAASVGTTVADRRPAVEPAAEPAPVP